MKKIYINILVALFFSLLGTTALKAQLVTLPDTVFVKWLNTHGYSVCLTGNQLDTTCPAVLSAKMISCGNKGITDLTGIQYFKSLDTLVADHTYLNVPLVLPDSLTWLGMDDGSNTGYFPSLPHNLRYLSCWLCGDTALPTLPDSLQYLNMSGNQLSILPALPSGLLQLNVSNNNLSSLPVLPAMLNLLYCDLNPIPVLPTLPDSLQTLGFGSPQLTTLPTAIPIGITNFYITNTNFTNFPITLPPSLTDLQFVANPNLDTLPVIPATVTDLNLNANHLSSLPDSLPPGLIILYCSFNMLTSLPPFPATLSAMECISNQLTSLSNVSLPAPFFLLQCDSNPLTSLPAMPDSMSYLSFTQCPNLQCLPKLPNVGQLFFSGTGIACLPNYPRVTTSDISIASYPICNPTNTYGCLTYTNITGAVYADTNSNCMYDYGEPTFYNVRVLLDSAGITQQVFIADSGGVYAFGTDSNGLYTVTIDTSALPFTVSCPPLSYPYTDSVSVTSPFYSHQDFALTCPTGFDVGVLSIAGSVFIPDNTTTVNIGAGDISNFYGGFCATGTNGTVTAIITGPATFLTPAFNALTPTTVSGDTVVWNVADFGATDFRKSFNMVLHTLYTAQLNDQVCINVFVTPAADNDSLNNQLSQCFFVQAAWDPNHKEVYPAGGIDSAQQWLTYTIHFQNTGTARARNIHIADTLSSNVDVNTLQLLNYSTRPTLQLFKGNWVRFNFQNIYLPDSSASLAGSEGFVQFKVKLKSNLPTGTRVNNTASIYFDANPAVVTNTVTNTVTTVTAIRKLSTDPGFRLDIFPNPASSQLYLNTFGNIPESVTIYDANGRIISDGKFAPQLDISALSSGVYLIEVKMNGNVVRKRFVKIG